jgi:hypothetical protein
MTMFDVEEIRAQVRTLDFTRGTAAEIAMWREDDADSRANLAIENMTLDPQEDALFDMLREEAVPPPLATAIVLKLLGHPDADPALAITPIGLA